MIPEEIELGYADPLIWDRLRPLVVEEIKNRARNLLSGQVKGIEDYREKLGFYTALTWVLQQEHELTHAPKERE